MEYNEACFLEVNSYCYSKIYINVIKKIRMDGPVWYELNLKYNKKLVKHWMWFYYLIACWIIIPYFNILIDRTFQGSKQYSYCLLF